LRCLSSPLQNTAAQRESAVKKARAPVEGGQGIDRAASYMQTDYGAHASAWGAIDGSFRPGCAIEISIGQKEVSGSRSRRVVVERCQRLDRMTPRGQFEDEAPWIIDPIARPVKIRFAVDDQAISGPSPCGKVAMVEISLVPAAIFLSRTSGPIDSATGAGFPRSDRLARIDPKSGCPFR
jgi:hypothetical protein